MSGHILPNGSAHWLREYANREPYPARQRPDVGHTGPAGGNFWILGSKERSAAAAVVLGAARKRMGAGVRGALFLRVSVLGRWLH
jgi:hypothetical protein